MTKIYNVGVYLRLSREDGDNIESESIINQRDFITSFLNKQENLVFIQEYVDDGYSGGNFDRPGWKNLIKDIENKKINTIITKDLSRMGRDHTEMGNYLEKIFPEKGIRYIALNDDIDTLYESVGNDYLLFKLVFNDYYLKDTSKKIKKIMKGKKEQGQYTGWKGVYGYKRNPEDKHKLIVDNEVKDIVIRIFNMVKDGYGVREIANILSIEGIPNPSTYANLKRGVKTPSSALWCPRTIEAMLKNPTYIGNLTQGIRKKVSYKSKKEIRVPEKEWIIVENTHEPIIDKDTFNIVQELLKKNNNNPRNINSYLLRGFIYCKECGHRIGINLSADKKRRYCHCCYYTSHSKFGLCTPHTTNYDTLENMILEQLRNYCKNYVNIYEIESKIKNKKRNDNTKCNLIKDIKNIEISINQVTNNIDKLYCDKLNGIIDLEQYRRLSLKFKENLEQLNIKKQELTEKLASLGKEDSKKEQEEILNIIKEFLTLKEPSRELLVSLIDKVVLSENKEVEIFYKFKVN